jgi:hypothetical protein
MTDIFSFYYYYFFLINTRLLIGQAQFMVIKELTVKEKFY